MKKNGREAEYLADQARVGRDPEYSARVYPIARDVLLAHPDYETYLTGKLQHLTENMLRSSTDEEYRRKSRIPGADTDYTTYLGVAYCTPGDMAFRMIGPGVFWARSSSARSWRLQNLFACHPRPKEFGRPRQGATRRGDTR